MAQRKRCIVGVTTATVGHSEGVYIRHNVDDPERRGRFYIPTTASSERLGSLALHLYRSTMSSLILTAYGWYLYPAQTRRGK
jgi:hypothetical protein